MKFKTDSWWFGAFICLLITFVAYEMVHFINDYYKINRTDWRGVRPQFVAMLALMGNIIPQQIFSFKRMDHAMRGLISITLILVIVWLIYYRHSIYG